MAFVNELRSRLQAKKREWDKCKADVKQAKEREVQVRDEMYALEILLRSEEPRSRKAAGKKAAPVPMALPLRPAISEENKAEAVRAIIREHQANGLKPAEVAKLAAERGVQLKTNYVYAVLLRGKRTKRLIEKNGRYFVNVEDDSQAEAAS